MENKLNPVLTKEGKGVRWRVPLKRGKLTDTKENQKLKQNVWIGWEVLYKDGTYENIEIGEFRTLAELYTYQKQNKGD